MYSVIKYGASIFDDKINIALNLAACSTAVWLRMLMTALKLNPVTVPANVKNKKKHEQYSNYCAALNKIKTYFVNF